MPASELKPRKRGASQAKPPAEDREGSSGHTAGEKAAETTSSHWSPAVRARPSLRPGFGCISTALWLAVSLGLAWLALHQNGRLAALEEKCGRATDVRERVALLSDKLDASEDDLRGALSSGSLGAELQQEVLRLRAAIMEEQNRENTASRDIQAISLRFLNVTEAWQAGLQHVAENISTLRAESQAAHGVAAQRVNEAESRLRSLEERLEELEESTQRNTRALQRTEEDDILRLRDQLDRNTERLRNLDEQQRGLVRRNAELLARLEEHVPRAQRCEEQLPTVEESVHTILRLSADLGATQRRVEDLTSQVLGVEDSMLKAVSEILELRQVLDALHVDSSVLEVKSDLSFFKETVTVLHGDRKEAITSHGCNSQQDLAEETTCGT
ncbi:hypothetical protein GN956_G2047 [Arapaima gigas]